ncbi:ATP-binding protein [Desertihabitans brevis]|uniref:ATP-binding protein n=1 Tax=Desertihabitans brevis TaxID=2268447 RepID=A0A367YSN5_9ACTN|nr:ATP-binding protein [Desertihabitans brevis]
MAAAASDRRWSHEQLLDREDLAVRAGRAAGPRGRGGPGEGGGAAAARRTPRPARAASTGARRTAPAGRPAAAAGHPLVSSADLVERAPVDPAALVGGPCHDDVVAIETPLVGRDAELGLLLGHWREAAAGARLTLLAAEAGGGKTTVIQELCRRIAAEPTRPLVLVGQSVPLGDEGLAFVPVQGVLRQLAASVDVDTIRCWAGAGVDELTVLLPSLGGTRPSRTGCGCSRRSPGCSSRPPPSDPCWWCWRTCTGRTRAPGTCCASPCTPCSPPRCCCWPPTATTSCTGATRCGPTSASWCGCRWSAGSSCRGWTRRR